MSLPSHFRNNVIPYMGVIKAQHGAPGPATGVTYDINVNLPDGVFKAEGVIPSGYRPPPELDVATIEPNVRTVLLWDVEGMLYFHFDEDADSEECDNEPPAEPSPSQQLLVTLASLSPADKAAVRAILGVAAA